MRFVCACLPYFVPACAEELKRIASLSWSLQLSIAGLELLQLMCDTVGDMAKGYTKPLFKTLVDRLTDTKQQVRLHRQGKDGFCFAAAYDVVASHLGAVW